MFTLIQQIVFNANVQFGIRFAYKTVRKVNTGATNGA